MKTRTTNRSRKIKAEPIEIEDISEHPTPSSAPQEEDQDPDNASEAAHAEDATDDDSVVVTEDEEVIPKRKSASRSKKPSTPSNRKIAKRVVKAASDAEYLDIPLPTQDVRAYIGQIERGTRGNALINAWYGPSQSSVAVMSDMLDRWSEYTVLPPKVALDDPGLSTRGLWLRDRNQLQPGFAETWLKRARDAMLENQTASLSLEDAANYRSPDLTMPVLMGFPGNYKEFACNPGNATAISQHNMVFDSDKSDQKVPAGWILDTGGIVTSLDWAARHDVQQTQILAMAVIPHTDQEAYNYETESKKPDFQKYGTVQLWEMQGQQVGGYMQPSTRSPTMKTLCFDFGRATKVKWCPVSQILAVLCNNGSVYIVDVRDDFTENELITTPMATFALAEDVKATAMTWVSVNRMAIGYQDGSIGLWSVYPTQLLARHPVHHTMIIDLVSGYPTLPYMICSAAVSGTLKMTDMKSPSFETTEAQSHAIQTQPGIMAYSDHMLGFLTLYPMSKVINTVVSFHRASHFPLSRSLFNADHVISCIAMGKTHPFLLIASLNGSVWAINPMRDFFGRRSESTDRIKLFQHEHRPKQFFPASSPASARGVSRLVHGFALEKNRGPPTDGKAPPKKKASKSAAVDEDDERVDSADKPKAALQEPLTRISAMAWNPNDAYGCWAAMAMASGIVRVYDLGMP